MRDSFRPRGHRLGAVCMLTGWLLAALPAFAGPADCDGELTNAQKEQRSFCETHLFCGMVFSIFDNCGAAKKWLNALPFSKDGSAITDSTVNGAVRSMRSAELLDDPDAPSFSDCSPTSFDRTRCRIFVGLDQPKIRTAPLPQPVAQLSPDTQRRARVLALYKEAENSRTRLGTPYGDTVIALNDCSEARQYGYRDKRCAEAQRWVERCKTFRNGWFDRKAAVLAEIEAAEPGIGGAYTPGISPLRGLGRQANSSEMWNDTVRGLKSLEIASCPIQVGDTGLSPEEALAKWEADDKRIPGNLPATPTAPSAPTQRPASPPPVYVSPPTAPAPSYQPSSPPSYQPPAPTYTPPSTSGSRSSYVPPSSSYTPSSTPTQTYSPPSQAVTTKTPVPVPQPKPQPKPSGPKYYPNLNCIRLETDNRGRRCGKNHCGFTSEMHWTGGMWSVGSGACYPTDKNAVLFGSCRKGDLFDRGRGMCKEW